MRSSSAGDFAGLVADEGGFDEGFDDGLFIYVELVDGFEVSAGVLGEIIVVAGEGVDAHRQGRGDAVEDVEGGLAGSLVPASLRRSCVTWMPTASASDCWVKGSAARFGDM